MEKIFKTYIIGNVKKKKKKLKETAKEKKYLNKRNIIQRKIHVTIKIEQKVRKIFIPRNGRKETRRARCRLLYKSLKLQ